MLESTYDDRTCVSHIAECRRVVVYDLRNSPTAVEYTTQTQTKPHAQSRDPDLFAVFHIYLETPCNPGLSPGRQILVTCDCFVALTWLYHPDTLKAMKIFHAQHTIVEKGIVKVDDSVCLTGLVLVADWGF